MVKAAITGGIACGKSLVGSLLGDAGVQVCELDALAHELMMPGQRVHTAVVEAFGEWIVSDSGEIDRRILGHHVFGSPDELVKLNAIVHPPVRTAWEKWLEQTAAAGRALAVVICPLLYELNEESLWDRVICVTCSAEKQMARLRERGLSEEDALRRIDAQMDVREKVARADYVIVNNGGLELLREQTMLVLESILGEADGR